MLIGILSDTHDRLDAAKAGIALLRKRGAELLIHCGDIGGDPILDELAGFPTVMVWGNCDFDRTGLARYAAEIGIDFRGQFAELEVDGKKIAVTHGDDDRLMRSIIAGDRFDYLLHGHTHVARNQKLGRLRVVNPGALFRASVKSVAVLDLAKDVVEILPVAI
jgi:uncharacterized protein